MSTAAVCLLYSYCSIIFNTCSFNVSNPYWYKLLLYFSCSGPVCVCGVKKVETPSLLDYSRAKTKVNTCTNQSDITVWWSQLVRDSSRWNHYILRCKLRTTVYVLDRKFIGVNKFLIIGCVQNSPNKRHFRQQSSDYFVPSLLPDADEFHCADFVYCKNIEQCISAIVLKFSNAKAWHLPKQPPPHSVMLPQLRDVVRQTKISNCEQFWPKVGTLRGAKLWLISCCWDFY